MRTKIRIIFHSISCKNAFETCVCTVQSEFIFLKKLAGLVSPSNKSGSHFITIFLGFFFLECVIYRKLVLQLSCILNEKQNNPCVLENFGNQNDNQCEEKSAAESVCLFSIGLICSFAIVFVLEALYTEIIIINSVGCVISI